MAGLLSLDELFEGRHFDREIIVLCVRWYLRFKLRFRGLVEMMAERGLSMAHTTIMRWVHHYAPEFERRWNRFARPAGSSWRVDETYVKIRGQWVYLYRAVDRVGNTVDFRLSPRRDVAAAKAFFRKAIKGQGSVPRSITLDGYAASHRAVHEMKADGELPADAKLRSSKYLNNLIEQDRRGVKLPSARCLASSNSAPRRLSSPGSNCSAGSARDSSISAGCASKTDVCPPSGMQSCLRNEAGAASDARVASCRSSGYLHQSHFASRSA
jgi:transposase-like protein